MKDRKEMDDYSLECAAVQVKRLADCLGVKDTDLFEKLIGDGIFTDAESADMAKYFEYER